MSTTGSGWLTNESALPYVLLHEEAYEIASVENRWFEPDAEYLKVRTTNGKTYLLRYEQQGDVWALETAKCPNCMQTLTEKALIKPKQFSTSDNVGDLNRSMQHCT